jgi:SHS2 domain-containing protein
MEEHKRWEHFPHAADVGIRGIGRTLEEAFEMAAVGLTAAVTNPVLVFPQKEMVISCSAPDAELLFVDWINALIYYMDMRQMLFSEFNIKITHFCLEATIKGESVNRERHKPAVDVKGATYTALKIIKEDHHWTAQCVVDV